MNNAHSWPQFQGITPNQDCGRCIVIASSSPVTDVDRAALTDLFKHIAEFGRRIRERRAAQTKESELAIMSVLPEYATDDVSDLT